MNPEMILDRMHDIRGLDAVGFWPPAWGWWLVAVILLGLSAFTVYAAKNYRRWLRRLQGGWRADAERQLRVLEQRIGRDDPKEVAAALSELLRRIAVARCGRQACAGLHGENWLAWLESRDPDRFAWSRHRALLLEMPYAPPGGPGDSRDGLKTLVAAARVWAGGVGGA